MQLIVSFHDQNQLIDGEFLQIEEEKRHKAQNGLWRKWGPYLSERQWGTVREDYSADGNAWSYLPHDHARSRAHRWGEDGIAGFTDHHQRLCLSLALWNARDPILKERLFGLTNSEGNHGEDCKELYYYLDATPTHAYLKMDAQGRNIFQGGFLGLDNIGVFDRSAPLPTGGFINQADGTSWMAMYSLNLMRIALELAQYNDVYEDIATKFFEHFLHIAEAMNDIGEAGIGLWDEEDEFYYDVLNLPDGSMTPLKVRSIVGLIPLFAVEVLEPESLEKAPEFPRHLKWLLNHRPDLASLVSRWTRTRSWRPSTTFAAARPSN